MTAGYSGTPLVKKLGIKSGMTYSVVDPPAHYRELLVGLPQDLTLAGRSGTGIDFVHLFVKKSEGLGPRLAALRERLSQNGMIWVSWPKKASGVATNLTEDIIREAGISVGLVDVKVCAVDETWSGLKFVIPRALRR